VSLGGTEKTRLGALRAVRVEKRHCAAFVVECTAMATVAERCEYLTVDEAARLLRQSRDTVRRKIHEGQIAAVRLGVYGPLRVPADALEQHLRPALESRRADVAATANGRSSPLPAGTREAA
jgi:excisionase family DNA binding protein